MPSFLIRQNPLFYTPNSNTVVRYLTTGTIVTPLGGDGGDCGDCGDWTNVFADGKTGYVRSDWLEAYIDPFQQLADLRLPQDSEIHDALMIGRAAQFLYLGAIGIKRTHLNLCGEFCCAAIAGYDVLPACATWMKAYPRAKSILADGSGTGIADLSAMLSALGIQSRVVRYDAKNPPSPGRLKDLGIAILGVGIKSNGAIDRDGLVRHWVVKLDCMPVGSTGILRVYNPYWNRLEIVEYRDLIEKTGGLTTLETAIFGHIADDSLLDASN